MGVTFATLATAVPTMRVSVLMTLYNKGPYVEEAVRSVLEQTYPDFELLVVDDKSLDDGANRVRAIKDPRIRLIEAGENLGRAGAANLGFAAARSEFIAILDADDVMMPTRLARQVEFLDAHRDVGVVGSWLKVIGQERDKPLRFRADDASARAMSLFGTPVIYGSCMIRRSVMMDKGIRCDPEWRYPGMDYLFLLELGKHTRYASIQESLTAYRIGPQNMRHGRDPETDAFVLISRVFRDFGVPATNDQIRLHRYFFNVLPKPASGSTVRALRKWMMDLQAWNRVAQVIPVVAFEAAFQVRWNRLFNFFADQGLVPGLLHLWYGGGWNGLNMRYLAAAFKKRLRAGTGHS